MNSTRLARYDTRGAEREGIPSDGQIDGVRAVVTGHTILAEVTSVRFRNECDMENEESTGQVGL